MTDYEESQRQKIIFTESPVPYLSIVPLIPAGIFEGLNPCLLTVIIFFISSLLWSGLTYTKIRVVGIFFVVSVFVTSLLSGVGLLDQFRALAIYDLLSKIFYFLLAMVSIGIGSVSLRDWWVYQHLPEPEKFILKLSTVTNEPSGNPSSLNRSHRNTLLSLRLILASVISGFVVIFFDSPCTGYSYLPTMIYLMSISGLGGKAFFYLVFTRVMFILPLLVFFILTLWLIRFEQARQVGKRHISQIKIVQAALFLSVGFGLLYTLHF